MIEILGSGGRLPAWANGWNEVKSALHVTRRPIAACQTMTTTPFDVLENLCYKRPAAFRPHTD